MSSKHLALQSTNPGLTSVNYSSNKELSVLSLSGYDSLGCRHYVSRVSVHPSAMVPPKGEPQGGLGHPGTITGPPLASFIIIIFLWKCWLGQHETRCFYSKNPEMWNWVKQVAPGCWESRCHQDGTLWNNLYYPGRSLFGLQLCVVKTW